MSNRDVLAPVAKFGVVGPATNTIVQPDFEMMRPVGVTNHYSRIRNRNPASIDDATFVKATSEIGENTIDAVHDVMACLPDRLVMGMSAVTFYGGVAGADAFEQRIADAAGIPVTIGSKALAQAVAAYGDIKRIAFLSPYYRSANREVTRFLEECGYEVVRDIALETKSWTGIAEFDDASLRDALRRLDGDDIDALLQVGTNLSMVRLAAAAELWLGKPVIAINTATYWHALRSHGINHRAPHLGRLFSDC